MGQLQAILKKNNDLLNFEYQISQVCNEALHTCFEFPPLPGSGLLVTAVTASG
jgi:hypothetical protein